MVLDASVGSASGKRKISSFPPCHEKWTLRTRWGVAPAPRLEYQLSHRDVLGSHCFSTTSPLLAYKLFSLSSTFTTCSKLVILGERVRSDSNRGSNGRTEDRGGTK